MTTKSLIAIAAALAAGFAVNASPAEAGGGIRLGFAGPLIGFVARETLNHAARPRAYHYERPSYRAARGYQERPTYKKHVAQSRKHDDDDDKSVKAKKKVEPRQTAEKSEKKDDTTVKQLATNAIPLEATAAAAGTSSAPQVLKLDSTATAETPSEAPAAGSKVESAALAPAATPAPATVETKAEVKADSKAKTADKTEKKSDCRRFVPSAGITITVRCND